MGIMPANHIIIPLEVFHWQGLLTQAQWSMYSYIAWRCCARGERAAVPISYQDFVEGRAGYPAGYRMDYGCGLSSKASIAKTLRELEDLDLIQRLRSADKDGRPIVCYRLSMDDEKPIDEDEETFEEMFYSPDPAQALKDRKEEARLRPSEWSDIKRRYDHRRLACGAREGEESVSGVIIALRKDHIVPVSMGGTDAPSNIQPLCDACNTKKTKRIIDYRPDRAR